MRTKVLLQTPAIRSLFVASCALIILSLGGRANAQSLGQAVAGGADGRRPEAASIINRSGVLSVLEKSGVLPARGAAVNGEAGRSAPPAGTRPGVWRPAQPPNLPPLSKSSGIWGRQSTGTLIDLVRPGVNDPRLSLASGIWGFTAASSGLATGR